MRRLVGMAGAAVVLAGAVVLGGHTLLHTSATVQAQAVKDAPRVTIYDSNVNFTAGNPAEGEWGFAPVHIAVTQGTPIQFDNPASNNFPHTVTSIGWSGTAPDRTLTSGVQFNSSPTKDAYIMPGGTFTLDTSALDPGQYDFYCTIHPWMVGTLTVEPAQ
jgi:plastocyanin